MTEGTSKILWRVDEECGMTLFVAVRCAFGCSVSFRGDSGTRRENSRKETETEKLQTT